MTVGRIVTSQEGPNTSRQCFADGGLKKLSYLGVRAIAIKKFFQKNLSVFIEPDSSEEIEIRKLQAIIYDIKISKLQYEACLLCCQYCRLDSGTPIVINNGKPNLSSSLKKKL